MSDEMSTPCPTCGATSADEANISCRGANDERLCGSTPHATGISAIGCADVGKKKAHAVLVGRPRHERRSLLDAERRARRSGDWGLWEHIDLPRGVPGASGWARDVRVAHRNKVFSVLERDAGFGVTHYAVSSLSQERPTWHEMQRIKDTLAGASVTAVEVYPPKHEIVDGADMYHFWVLPNPLHFSLHRAAIAEPPCGAGVDNEDSP